MKYFFGVWNGFFAVITAIFMGSLGILLLLWLIGAPIFMLVMVILFALLVLVVIGSHFGIWSHLTTLFLELASRIRKVPSNIQSGQLNKPVQIASFHYKLDDPIDSHTFNTFLDKPAFTLTDEKTGDETEITPAELVQDQIVRYVKFIEKAYNGQVFV